MSQDLINLFENHLGIFGMFVMIRLIPSSFTHIIIEIFTISTLTTSSIGQSIFLFVA